MKFKTLASITFAGLLVVGTGIAAMAGCGVCGTKGDHSHGTKAMKSGAPEKTASMTIVETAVTAGNFETLVTAVKAAGLADVLSGEGPFTVFAPTDAAFAALPTGTVESLLKDKDQLTSILTYHVVPGKVMASDVVELSAAETVQGAQVSINTSKSSVKVDNANVVKTDIVCSNGVIHVIDAVIMPRNIIETAMNAGSFNTLLAAVEAAGLSQTLAGEGPFTVFAPTDAAFAKLPEGAVESLLKDTDRLSQILTYHVVPGKVFADDVAKLSSATTVQGQQVRIDASQGVKVNQARVIAPDVVAGNGVIHVIDQVLLPN